jgi:ring-1,2-phenylacetyl-CoA epoxidase subunit PaaD
MSAIEEDIRAAVDGVDVSIETVLSPAWTTDWMTTAGKTKLRAAGIAPPTHLTGEVPLILSVRCPQCGSTRTSELSRFGSTSCKALWRCDDCLEPFDSFKVL